MGNSYSEASQPSHGYEQLSGVTQALLEVCTEKQDHPERHDLIENVHTVQEAEPGTLYSVMNCRKIIAVEVKGTHLGHGYREHRQPDSGTSLEGAQGWDRCSGTNWASVGEW
ncbi:uncharacterized protein ACIBXB_020787 isoform 1-T1 [Morphnus guianensis]